MPSKPMKRCSYPRCTALVSGGKCDEHRRKEYKRYDESRGNSGQRGYSNDWQRVRAIKKRMNPFCEMCLKAGEYVVLDVIHHVRTIEEAPELRLSMDNLMSCCAYHHELIHNKLHKSC